MKIALLARIRAVLERLHGHREELLVQGSAQLNSVELVERVEPEPTRSMPRWLGSSFRRRRDRRAAGPSPPPARRRVRRPRPACRPCRCRPTPSGSTACRARTPGSRRPCSTSSPPHWTDRDGRAARTARRSRRRRSSRTARHRPRCPDPHPVQCRCARHRASGRRVGPAVPSPPSEGWPVGHSTSPLSNLAATLTRSASASASVVLVLVVLVLVVLVLVLVLV